MKSKFLVVVLFGFCGSFLLAQSGDTISTISPRLWTKVTYRFKPAKKVGRQESQQLTDTGTPARAAASAPTYEPESN